LYEVFIAQDPDSQSVVVAHQGTDPEELLSDANDVEIAQVAMNSTLFPSAASEEFPLILET
jgi:hypothetical protein